MASKKKQRLKRKSSQKFLKLPPKRLIEQFEAADRLIKRKRWAEAFEALRALDQNYPHRPEILTELVNVCYELDDLHSFLVYCQRLFKLTPKDPETMFTLAGGAPCPRWPLQ
jgi:hypothetical protein